MCERANKLNGPGAKGEEGSTRGSAGIYGFSGDAFLDPLWELKAETNLSHTACERLLLKKQHLGTEDTVEGYSTRKVRS